MINIQLTSILKKIIVKTINENEADFINSPEPILASDDRISFKIYFDISKDKSLLPVPVDQLDDLLPNIKEKLPKYIGISAVKFK